MTGKYFIDKTKEFKASMIFFFLILSPSSFSFLSSSLLQNSGAISRKSLENKSPQVKILYKPKPSLSANQPEDLTKLWDRCGNFLPCHANTSRKTNFSLTRCFRSYLTSYFPRTFLLIVSTIDGFVVSLAIRLSFSKCRKPLK